MDAARGVIDDVRANLSRRRPDLEGLAKPSAGAANLANCTDLVSHATHLAQDAQSALDLGLLDFAQNLVDLAQAYVLQAEDCLAGLV